MGRQEKRMRKRKLVTLFPILFLVACAARPPHPNQVSLLDGQAYDVLVTANTTIDQSKAALAAGTIPAQSKEVINAAVASYNVLRGAWLTYRHTVELAAPGTPPSVEQTAVLKSAMTDLTTAISNLQGLTKGGGK